MNFTIFYKKQKNTILVFLLKKGRTLHVYFIK